MKFTKIGLDYISLQWNLLIADTLGTGESIFYSEVKKVQDWCTENPFIGGYLLEVICITSFIRSVLLLIKRGSTVYSVLATK